MRISKIASSVGKHFQNLPIFGVKFWLSKLKSLLIYFINFPNFKISGNSIIFEFVRFH